MLQGWKVFSPSQAGKGQLQRSSGRSLPRGSWEGSWGKEVLKSAASMETRGSVPAGDADRERGEAEKGGQPTPKLPVMASCPWVMLQAMCPWRDVEKGIPGSRRGCKHTKGSSLGEVKFPDITKTSVQT